MAGGHPALEPDLQDHWVLAMEGGSKVGSLIFRWDRAGGGRGGRAAVARGSSSPVKSSTVFYLYNIVRKENKKVYISELLSDKGQFTGGDTAPQPMKC